MKDIITSREEALLAKLAGRDADLSTFTPPVASSLKEKLMLEIADRLDDIGGGNPNFEVVAEIEVGEMIKDGSTYYTGEMAPFEVPTNRQLYFNSKDYPLTVNTEQGISLYFNANLNTGEPVDPSKPMYYIFVDVDKMMIASSDEIANTTVQILAGEAVAVQSELPTVTSNDNSEFVVTITWNNDGGTNGGTNNYSSDKNISEIANAIESRKTLIALVPSEDESNNGVMRCPLVSVGYNGYGNNIQIDGVIFSCSWASSSYIHVLTTSVDYQSSVTRTHAIVNAQT